MSMESAIRNFPTQFGFEPVIANSENLAPAKKFVLAGMGGSHLAAGILKRHNPFLDFHIHRDYGLPLLTDEMQEHLFIASSYSGNTEEVVDFAEKARRHGLPVASIATGGTLIDLAQEHGTPYIQLPDTDIQPRSALGFSLLGLAALTHDTSVMTALHNLQNTLKPDSFEDTGKRLAKTLHGKIPIIYTSAHNEVIAYNWKIKFNETGKIPAFYNVFPELNHNEMTGFDIIETTRELAEIFHIIVLTYERDDARIQKRMKVCTELYEERGLPVTMIPLSGDTIFDIIFSSLLLADWTALYTAKHYKTEPEEVPMIETFKKRIVS